MKGLGVQVINHVDKFYYLMYNKNLCYYPFAMWYMILKHNTSNRQKCS